MAFPTVIVEISFTGSPLDASPAWTDVSAYARHVKINRGKRGKELDAVEAGTATITLDNRDRRFDPLNTSSPYVDPQLANGRIIPMLQVRVRATYNAVTYNLFRGFIRSWPQSYPMLKGDAIAEIQCIDAFHLLSLYPVAVFSDEIGTDAPVGWWKLQETLGTTATDSGSGTAANGTYTNGPTVGSRTAPHPGSLGTPDFDGSNDYMAVSGSPAKLANITGDFTVAFWIYKDAHAGLAHTLFNALGFQITEDTDEVILNLDFPSGGASELVTYDTRIPTGGWHYVTVTRDADEGYLRYYLDGALTATWHVTRAAISGFGSFTAMAAGGGTSPVNGSMAHLAIYDKVLSAERIAAHHAAKVDAMVSAATGTVVAALLDAIGWPSAQRTLDAGSSTIAAHTPAGSFLDALQRVANEAELGLLFVYPDGKIGFHQRHAAWSTSHNASIATFGDGGGSELPYADIVIEYDEQDIQNEVSVQRLDGTAQLATEASYDALTGSSTTPHSRTKYGPRRLERTDVLLATDNEARDQAFGVMNRFKNPYARITQLTIKPRRDEASLFPQVLARDVHWDKITVKRRPPGGGTITRDVFIVGIEGEFDRDRTWVTTWYLEPADDAYTGQAWLLGDNTYGVLGSTTRLGW